MPTRAWDMAPRNDATRHPVTMPPAFNRGSHAFQVKITYGVNSSHSVTLPTSIGQNERKRVGPFFDKFALAIGIDNVVHRNP
jgi:hypothetical protein